MRIIKALSLGALLLVPGIGHADCNVSRVFGYGQSGKITASFKPGIAGILIVKGSDGSTRHYSSQGIDSHLGEVLFKWDDAPPATADFVVIGAKESLEFDMPNAAHCTLTMDEKEGKKGLAIRSEAEGQVQESFIAAEPAPPF